MRSWVQPPPGAPLRQKAQSHMQENTDIVQKWTYTGLLRDVKPQYIQHAAERLEAAAKKSIGTGNFIDFDNVIRDMVREGIFVGKRR